MARRYVLCRTCDGLGWLHPDECGELFPVSFFEEPHRATLPGVEPCDRCVRCSDCGHGECDPGVRMVETRNDLVASEVMG